MPSRTKPIPLALVSAPQACLVEKDLIDFTEADPIPKFIQNFLSSQVTRLNLSHYFSIFVRPDLTLRQNEITWMGFNVFLWDLFQFEIP